MKKFSVSLVALTAALLMAPSAQAATTPGWYAALGVGVAFPQDPTMTTGTTKRQVSEETTNLALSKSIGYAFDNGIRLELEGYYNNMNVKSVNQVQGTGSVTNMILFANVIYDFNNKSRVTPYIGAGFGGDYVDIDNVGTTAGKLNGDEIVGAYQAIVGLAVQLDPNWALTADYRYIGAFDSDVGYSDGTNGKLTNASQNAMFGVRYSFGGDSGPEVREVAAPAVTPRKAVKAPVAPVANNFTVFFDFDKATLTPEAKNIIAAATKEFKKDGFATIAVTGHTDTMGTEKYNLKLSDRRAAAVKAELATLGVEASSIREKGAGKGSLLVPTTDGVREAQNRRAEIVLSK